MTDRKGEEGGLMLVHRRGSCGSPSARVPRRSPPAPATHRWALR